MATKSAKLVWAPAISHCPAFSPAHTRFSKEFDNRLYVDLEVLSTMALFFLKFPLHLQMIGSPEPHPVTLKLIKLKLSSSVLAVLSCTWTWECSQGGSHINVTLSSCTFLLSRVIAPLVLPAFVQELVRYKILSQHWSWSIIILYVYNHIAFQQINGSKWKP